MKKLVYLAGDECTGENGVAKKIRNEIYAFKMNDINADLHIVKENRKLKKIIPLSSTYAWDKIVLNDVNYLYIRWEPASYPFIKMLRNFKRKNPNSKILIEIGTYPYETELKHMSNIITISRDRFYRRFLKKYVDRVIDFCGYDTLFGIKTIEIVNPIDVSLVKIPTRNVYRDDDVINVIAISSIEFYYGFDRIIKGLWNYYKTDPETTVIFHIIGEGNVLDELKQLVSNLSLDDYVKFYGFLSGKDLDEIYDIADIGIDVLGGHRKGVTAFGSLKSREYICKGIPFITETSLPSYLEPIKKYILSIPADESDIDIDSVVTFFRQIRKETKLDVLEHMRDFANSKFDISVALDPVIEYIKET